MENPRWKNITSKIICKLFTHTDMKWQNESLPFYGSQFLESRCHVLDSFYPISGESGKEYNIKMRTYT
jgi:hypothetical protein